jgi:transposase
MPIMPKRLDRKELYAFEFLRSKGLSRLEIQAELKIGRATYYKRIAQLERMKRHRKQLMGASA